MHRLFVIGDLQAISGYHLLSSYLFRAFSFLYQGINMKKLITVALLISLTSASYGQKIETLTPGTLVVAVTTDSPSSEYDPQLWIRRYIQEFAKKNQLVISWVTVEFNESWLLASKNEVDLVATNVANFPDRANPGATFSEPFLYERRALRIKASNQDNYRTLDDFIGKKVGAVAGMAAERDLVNRAPPGVEIRITNTFPELYEDFERGELDAIAEAEYYTLNNEVIPSHDENVALIDHHDLIPGQREESVFVVSNQSRNLLQALNSFIRETKFPVEI